MRDSSLKESLKSSSSSSAIDGSYLSTFRSGRSFVLSSLGFLVNGLLSVFDIVSQERFTRVFLCVSL